MPTVTLNSHAKVNWHLAVGGRQTNGYHPIASVFQRACLHDVVSVSLEGRSSRTFVMGLGGCVSAGCSTVDKAVSLWREATMSKADVLVDVQKNIPVQSGLGGGSSNAATVLLALNSLSSSKLPFATLCKIGLAVGCDVPFFMHGCDAACVFGVGEVVNPIEARHDLEGFLLVPEGEKTSTSKAYAALDGRATVQTLESFDMLYNEYCRPYVEWNFRNDFGLVNKRPSLPILEGERLFLTGSGSCWVLLSNSQVRADIPRTTDLKAVPIRF